MGICMKSSSQPAGKKKNVAIHLWRINSTLDPSISKKAVDQFEAMEKLCSKELRLVAASKLSPYNQLTLERRKYTELTFDFERRRNKRIQIQKSLRSILVNRHRKERLTFLCYFLRFYKNTANFIVDKTFRPQHAKK